MCSHFADKKVPASIQAIEEYFEMLKQMITTNNKRTKEEAKKRMQSTTARLI